MKTRVFDDGCYIVAVVRADGIEREVKCTKPATRRELNFIYTLGEHVSRVISVNDICYRMQMSENSMRQLACHLRKKLHHDWSIESVSNKGMRLCYIGSRLADADITHVEIKPRPHRRRHQSEETREKIRQTQKRKKSYLNFRKSV